MSENPLWISRLKNIGSISVSEVLNFGFSGPIARSSGINFDIRKDFPYEKYKNITFSVPVNTKTELGDSLDRFYIRLFEMFESCKILEFCISEITANSKFSKQNNNIINMEQVIQHFKKYSTPNFVDIIAGVNQSFLSTETPKGELGCYIKLTDSNINRCCYIKSSGFTHVNFLNLFNKESFISDLVTIIGSADLVFGEIDR